MKLIVAKNYEEMSKLAAEFMAEELEKTRNYFRVSNRWNTSRNV